MVQRFVPFRGSLRVPPDVLTLEAVRDEYNNGVRLRIHSRVYDFGIQYEIRDRWGDPMEILQYAEALIGHTVSSWHQCRIGSRRGRDMAQALIPHWQAAIQEHMLHLEQRYMHMVHVYIDEAESPDATKKARELLMQHLNTEQIDEFNKKQQFQVKAKDGKTYTILHTRAFNVVGPDGTKYCGQLTNAPIYDQMLAQKLLLEQNPDKFFKNANISRGLGGDHDVWAARYNDPQGPWR